MTKFITVIAIIGAVAAVYASSSTRQPSAQNSEPMEKVISEAMDVANADLDKEKWSYERLAQTAIPMGFPPGDPDRFVGKYVRATPTTGCFKYDARYLCSGYSNSIKGQILVVSDHLTGDVKDRVDHECGDLQTMCRADIIFLFDSWKTDPSGQAMVIRAGTIHTKTPERRCRGNNCS